MLKRMYRESQAKRASSLKANGAMDYLSIFIATGFGSGFLPRSPGTYGSLVGLLIAYELISVYKSDVLMLQNSLIVAGLISAVVGIWASIRAERIFDKKDAGQIVIDEVCGQLITFVFIAPYLVKVGPNLRWWMLAGFALFRFFDNFKIYPIKRMEALTGGLGVMMDDVIAGIYAAVVLSLALAFAV